MSTLTASPARARIFLSPPHIGADERSLVKEAFDTNWIAPVGPHLSAFEEEMCAASGIASALCVSSGTAALHLAAHLVGVGPGDEVFCPTFSFVATANPVLYQGARPVFIDSEPASWNMDPDLLASALSKSAKSGRPPKAVIVADIYGQCASWDEIREIAASHGVPVIEDAAEAVGATFRSQWAGGFGRIGVYSFNGNKIMTTSGGGMLVSNDAEIIEKARKLSTQARDDAPHYQHSEMGYNYRMSNVLAAIGRGQLRSLDAMIARRREIFAYYSRQLRDLPGVAFMPEAPGTFANRWLTCMTVDPAGGATAAAVLAALDADNIEARPLWKPLHLQPLFRGAETHGGAVSERLFSRGLCLPSGSSMTGEDLHRVVSVIRRVFGHV